MSFLLNPFVFAGAAGDFESIASTTVGSGGASTITFSSIPSTYQHLQIRGITRTSRANSGDVLILQMNSDTGNNYPYHRLIGNGSSASAASATTTFNGSYIVYSSSTTDSASMFAGAVIDILDYASSTKTTTLRSFSGVDRNGTGQVWLASSMWTSTNAVTSITLKPNFGTGFAEHSTFTLFGIKA